MSESSELDSQAKQEIETRKILGPGGNRVRVFEEEKKKKDGMMKNKKQQPGKKTNDVVATKKLVSHESLKFVAVKNGLADICSDSSLCNGSAAKSVSIKKKSKNSSVNKAAKIVPDGGEILAISPIVRGPVKRCDWITPNSGKLTSTMF